MAPVSFLRGAVRSTRTWTWAAVLLSVGVCAVISWLHFEQRRTIARTERTLGGIRQARLDLARGFLHVSLAGDPRLPYRREEGLALLEQGIAALDRAWSTSDGRAPGEGPSRADFERVAREFKRLLASADRSGAASSPDVELGLRIAFHELERQAGRIDRDSQRELHALSAGLDGAFAVTLAAAVFLLTLICVGVWVAGREQAAAIRALRESEERLRVVGDNLPDAYVYQYVRSPDGARRFEYVSAGVERVHGVTAAEVLRDPTALHGLVDEPAREALLRAEDASASDLSDFETELWMRRSDGERRLVRVASRPRRIAGGGVRWDGIATDHTELWRAQEERRKAEEQLRQSQKMEAIGQLAGGVAHDFNNLLSAILMQVELAAGADGLPAEVHEGLREIRAAGLRAANLTRQLLAFSRRQVMQLRDVDVNGVVTEIARMLQRIIGEDVRLHLVLNPRPAVTRGDAGLLEQVLVNLAVNARDAMPKGGELRIETSEIDADDGIVQREPDAVPGRHVCVAVTDTGTGIAPEVMPHIFEPFFTTKERGKGTGLGLATVFGIVKQHRGWVSVASAPRQGTTVRVFLPSIERAAEPREVYEPAPAGPGAGTILLVEDDPGVRKTARAALERVGYDVFEAADGPEALAVWARRPDRVALLLTDLVMPEGIDGRELGRRLRAEAPSLKVVYMSGYSSALGGREVDLERGETFLQKPFGVGQLLEVVRQALEG